jgi:hypothetical protein
MSVHENLRKRKLSPRMLAPFPLASSTKAATPGPAVSGQRRLPFDRLSDDQMGPWIATFDERWRGTFQLPASACCRIQERGCEFI